jgi:anti-sigma factor (TIGR02949 family)
MSDLPPDPCAAPAGPGEADCTMVLQQLWDYLDSELGADKMQAVRTHLTLCSKCYPLYDFEKAFLEAIADCRCTTCAPNDVRCHVIEALRRVGFCPDEQAGIANKAAG